MHLIVTIGLCLNYLMKQENASRPIPDSPVPTENSLRHILQPPPNIAITGSPRAWASTPPALAGLVPAKPLAKPDAPPDLTQAALKGDKRGGLSLRKLMTKGLPIRWDQQDTLPSR